MDESEKKWMWMTSSGIDEMESTWTEAIHRDCEERDFQVCGFAEV
jgi:hypothetical protein